MEHNNASGENRVSKARRKFTNVVDLTKLRLLDLEEGFTNNGDSSDSQGDTSEDLNLTSSTSKSKCFWMIFERSLELSQFTQNPNLYPVIREWFRGSLQKDASSRKRKFSDISDEGEDGAKGISPSSTEMGAVYDLPAPLAEERKVYDYMGNEINPRVPDFLPQFSYNQESIFTLMDRDPRDESQLPSPSDLFQEHKFRWSAVNEHWKQHASNNESRYLPSLKVIMSCQET